MFQKDECGVCVQCELLKYILCIFILQIPVLLSSSPPPSLKNEPERTSPVKNNSSPVKKFSLPRQGISLSRGTGRAGGEEDKQTGICNMSTQR